MKIRSFFAVLGVLFVSTTVSATGILVPKDEGLPPLAIKYHRVNVAIRDQVAQTSVEQLFHNGTSRQLEATFIFPLPEGASLSEFAMMMNGKRVAGELVEKEEAARIYEDIVRKMRDPGLLEYVGRNLLRARVFPIPPNGDQKIEVRYSEVVPYDAGIFRYVYPLKTEDKASQTIEDFSMGVRISTGVEIKSVYSPTHEVGISRPGKNEVVVGFEKDKAYLDRDFVLYFTVSEQDVGLNLLTYRDKEQDGYFLLLIAPGADLEKEEVLPKDVTFVIDTSGSMQEDDKIGQVRSALSHCLRSLAKEDRFNVVKFSTGVETFKPDLVEASQGNTEEALKFAESMTARGGTDIFGALTKAVSIAPDESRPHVILFLTDGRPTVGETTDKDEIAKAVEKNNSGKARIFVFGVGSDVNTHLLDLVSSQNGGVSEYVEPRAEIEERVSAIYRKLSKPVFANVALSFGDIETYDVFPQKPGDIFAGTQLKLFGRYRGNGHTAIKLSGKVRGGDRTFTYDSSFEEKNTERNFIPRLWANRKVGYLLDEVRLHGESKELVAEVKTLSKEFGIMTPYTSYLITEEKHQVASGGEPQPRAAVDGDLRLGSVGTSTAKSRAAGRGGVTAGAGRVSDEALSLGYAGREEMSKLDSGAQAIQWSESIRDLKETEGLESPAAMVTKYIEGRTFYFDGEYWIDADYRDAKDPKVIEVKYAGDAYFQLLRKDPKIGKLLAIGEKVIVKVGKVFIKVTDTGKDTLTDEELKEIFG